MIFFQQFETKLIMVAPPSSETFIFMRHLFEYRKIFCQDVVVVQARRSYRSQFSVLCQTYIFAI